MKNFKNIFGSNSEEGDQSEEAGIVDEVLLFKSMNRYSIRVDNQLDFIPPINTHFSAFKSYGRIPH